MHPQDREYFKQFAHDARNNRRSLSEHYIEIQMDTSGGSKANASDYFPGFERIGKFLDPNSSFLAMGCGAGVEVDWLRRNGCADITGLDISEKLLQKCEADFGIKTVRADMRNTGLPHKSFDVVLSCRSLHHMFYPYAAVEEMARLAKTMVWIVAEPVKSLVKEIPRKILGKRIISGANIYEFQFDLDDLSRYMAFNGMSEVARWRFWESSAQRASICRKLNRIAPFAGNRFAAVYRTF